MELREALSVDDEVRLRGDDLLEVGFAVVAEVGDLVVVRVRQTSGMRPRAAALSSMPQESRVSKVRLSVATTEVGGDFTVCLPLLSSTVTVPEAPAAFCSLDSALAPQPDRARARTPRAAPRRSRVEIIVFYFLEAIVRMQMKVICDLA